MKGTCRLHLTALGRRRNVAAACLGAVALGAAGVAVAGPGARALMTDPGASRVFAPLVARGWLGDGPPPAPLPPDPLDIFFDTEIVHELTIDVDAAGVAALLERPREYVHARVRIDDAVYDDVGVRLKGGPGSFIPLDGDYPPVSGDGNGRPGKSAFIVDFNRYVRGLRHLGLGKLTVNNMTQDPSGIHELLGYALFRAGGVPASRSGFALVRFNGLERGLYALVETTDNAEFLERWYGSRDGNLYEGGHDADFRADAVERFDQDNGRDQTRRDLRELVAALDAIGPRDDSLPVLEAWFDLDEVLTFMATELYLGHWDGYAWSTNNFIVHHAVDGQWTFLPWGLDQLFEDPLGPYGGVMRAPGPAWEGGGRVQALCFRSPGCRERLAHALAAVLDRAEALDLAVRAHEARRVVEPLLLAESERYGDPELTVRALDQVTRHIAGRRESVERWLPCLTGGRVDHDGDGADGCTADCDDRDPNVHPGAPETCNRVDDDCNGIIDDPAHCPKCVPERGPGGELLLCFERLTWPAARDACRDRGAELVSLHDEAALDHLTVVLRERIGAGSGWTGLNDRAREGAFAWSDGTPFDFERWLPGAPKREGPDAEACDCVLALEHAWLDVPCDEEHAYACLMPR